MVIFISLQGSGASLSFSSIRFFIPLFVFFFICTYFLSQLHALDSGTFSENSRSLNHLTIWGFNLCFLAVVDI